MKRRFIDQETNFTGRFSRHVALTISESFAPFKAWVIAYLAIGVFARLSLLSTANITGYWADSLCKGGAYCKDVPGPLRSFSNVDYLQLLVGVVVAGFILNVIFRVGISRTGAKAVSILYDEVTMRVSRQPMSFFDKTPVGRIMSRFSTDYAAIFRMAGGPLGEFIGIAFDLLAILVLLSLASIYYVPLVVLAGIAYYWLYKLNTPRLRAERRAYAAVRGPSIAHFAETVQGARLIKVYGKTSTFTKRFDRLVSTLVQQRIGLAIVAQSYSLQMALVTVSLLLLTGLAGISLVTSGKVSAGSLATAFTFILIASTTIQQFFEWLANLEDALTGVERLDDYLRRPLEAGSRLPLNARFTPLVKRRSPSQTRDDTNEPAAGRLQATESTSACESPKGAEIRIENLWLRYADDLPWVLQGLHLHIAPGERIAIIGRTGSGKSTLIQALYLLYLPQQGHIIIDGVTPDLSSAEPHIKNNHAAASHVPHIDLESFRRKIALIPQEPTLFRGTLRDNLVAFSGATDDRRIWKTLADIGLDRWVETLSHGKGLDYEVEERGSNLSAGERQLLCMARCFLSDAPVVVTDEATSAIDPASEELLVRALEERTKGRTLIIVAHRLSTVETCDRVLWLEQGRAKMLGKPSEVLPLFSAHQPP